MAPGSSEGGPPGAAQQHRATGNGAEGGQDPRDAPGTEETAMGQSPRRGCRISPKAPHSGAGGVHRPPQGHTQSHFQLMWEGGDRAAGGQTWSWCELAPGHQQQPRSQGLATEHRLHPTPATTGAGWGLCPGEGSGLCYKQSSAGTFLSPACDDCQLPPALSLPRGFRRPPRCAGSLRCKCGARYNPGEGTARHEAPRGGTASLPGYRGGGHQA